jgi:RimJ/RimL family protein N-acetyltransferase
MMDGAIKNAQQKVTLRALAFEDFDRVLKWHNDPDLYSTLEGHFRHVSAETEKEWLRQRIEARDEVNLAVCLYETNEHIGNIYLRNIERINRNAALGLFIAVAEHRGKGYGSQAVQQLIHHAFEDLGLTRIYLYVLASNAPAIATYEKCGFLIEGRLRRHVLKDHVYQDLLVMGLCRD